MLHGLRPGTTDRNAGGVAGRSLGCCLFGLTLPAFCLPALVPACGRLSCRKHAYGLRRKSDARTRSRNCFGLSGAGDGALAGFDFTIAGAADG
jgi:hypothetical protein